MQGEALPGQVDVAVLGAPAQPATGLREGPVAVRRDDARPAGQLGETDAGPD